MLAAIDPDPSVTQDGPAKDKEDVNRCLQLANHVHVSIFALYGLVRMRENNGRGRSFRVSAFH